MWVASAEYQALSPKPRLGSEAIKVTSSLSMSGLTIDVARHNCRRGEKGTKEDSVSGLVPMTKHSIVSPWFAFWSDNPEIIEVLFHHPRSDTQDTQPSSLASPLPAFRSPTLCQASAIEAGVGKGSSALAMLKKATMKKWETSK